MKSFTLIELLVVIAIFSMVVGAITNAFFSSISAQRKMLAEQELLNQVSYVLEYMGRAIRMAKKDDIEIFGQEINCLGGENVNFETSSNFDSIKFRNYQNQCQKFYLENEAIWEEKGEQSQSFPLTSTSTLRITNLKFQVSGDSEGNQPRVTISLEVESAKIKNPPKLYFQTTISQRDLNR